MNKILSIFFVIIALVLVSGFVSAWHCADTDEVKPKKINGLYGSWGDDAFIGGTSTGYLDKNVPLPEGCTGTKVVSGRHFWYKNVECEDSCDGYTLTEYYCGDRPKYKGETVMFWNTYENSNECGYNEVPEFGVITAGIALVGALAGFVIIRNKSE